MTTEKEGRGGLGLKSQFSAREVQRSVSLIGEGSCVGGHQETTESPQQAAKSSSDLVA